MSETPQGTPLPEEEFKGFPPILAQSDIATRSVMLNAVHVRLDDPHSYTPKDWADWLKINVDVHAGALLTYFAFFESKSVGAELTRELQMRADRIGALFPNLPFFTPRLRVLAGPFAKDPTLNRTAVQFWTKHLARKLLDKKTEGVKQQAR